MESMGFAWRLCVMVWACGVMQGNDMLSNTRWDAELVATECPLQKRERSHTATHRRTAKVCRKMWHDVMKRYIMMWCDVP